MSCRHNCKTRRVELLEADKINGTTNAFTGRLKDALSVQMVVTHFQAA
ncbi:hypothetical protein [Kingella kingae]|nr:hypothetical protein [Kingella kingae]